MDGGAPAPPSAAGSGPQNAAGAAAPHSNAAAAGASAPRDYDEESGPWRFLKLGRAFGPSRAFQVAVKLGLFDALQAHARQHGRGMTWQEAAAALGLKSDPGFRGVVDLMDLLVAEDCIAREGDGPGATYRNTPAGERYLVSSSDDYVGGLVVINCDRTYPQFLFLEDSLRSAQQPPAAKALVPDILATFGGAADPDAPMRFALGMTGANLAAFRELAAKFDFSRYKTLLDVGGSAGSLSCAVAAAHPHMRCVTADLPPLLGAAREQIARRGLEGRVAAEALDFFAAEKFPPADVITMSMILHDWGVEKKESLIRKAFAALPPGGAFVALDLLIDDARRANRWGLYQSLSMLTEFDRECAFDYSYADFRGWAAAAGFGRTEMIDLGGPASAAVAYKDA